MTTREEYTKDLLERCFREMELVSTRTQEIEKENDEPECLIVRLCFCRGPRQGE